MQMIVSPALGRLSAHPGTTTHDGNGMVHGYLFHGPWPHHPKIVAVSGARRRNLADHNRRPPLGWKTQGLLRDFL